MGILTPAGIPFLAEIFADVQHARDPQYRPKNPNAPFRNKPSAGDPRYRQELRRVRDCPRVESDEMGIDVVLTAQQRGLAILNIPIKAIGVWETVGEGCSMNRDTHGPSTDNRQAHSEPLA